VKNKNKNKKQRLALFETVLIFLLLGGAIAGVLLWAAKSEDSELAQSIREFVGMPNSKPVEVVIVPLPLPPVVEAIPEPEPVVVPESEPLPEITFKEVAAQRYLWPSELNLKLAVRVPIRYDGKDYGFMEFLKGVPIQVDALIPSGEIFCQIDGNYLSLSVYETDFYGWFKDKYGERYDLQSVIVDMGTKATTRHRLGTPEGETDFWAEMRIWCHQNYGSVSLKVEEDSLVFLWLPKEDVPINFPAEAREIARNYLLKRAKYGGKENYAACEIRDPVTHELRGAGSIFIPRL